MSYSDSNSDWEPPASALWGCELSSARSSHTFPISEDGPYELQLVLHTVCLGEKARDEFHVLEVVPEAGDSRAPVPLVTLKPSVQPTVALSGLELTPPVTFRLRAGSGPVYVSGQTVPEMDLSSDEDYDDEDEEDEDDESPEKPPKRSGARKGGTAKERQLKKKAGPTSLGPRDRPRAKGRGAGRGRKAAPKK